MTFFQGEQRERDKLHDKYVRWATLIQLFRKRVGRSRKSIQNGSTHKTH